MKIPKLKYVSREKYLFEAISGKKVLHLGCVGERVVGEKEKYFHEYLMQSAKIIWGVDIDYEGLEKLRIRHQSQANLLILGDATMLESLNLPNDFDLIIAGDIIEHLVNPSALFNSLNKFLINNSAKIIITTPNALGILTVLRAITGYEKINEDHCCWFSFSTLHKIATINGWKIDALYTGYDREPKGFGIIKIKIGKIFFRIFPQWGGTLIAELSKK